MFDHFHYFVLTPCTMYLHVTICSFIDLLKCLCLFLEWVTTLLAFSAYHPFDWLCLPFKCEIFALGPTQFAYNPFDYELPPEVTVM